MNELKAQTLLALEEENAPGNATHGGIGIRHEWEPPPVRRSRCHTREERSRCRDEAMHLGAGDAAMLGRRLVELPRQRKRRGERAGWISGHGGWISAKAGADGVAFVARSRVESNSRS